MAAPKNAPQEIDRKLHRIVLESDPTRYPTASALGRALNEAKKAEFSYQRGGKTNYSAYGSIARYVLYGKEVGLLDGDLKSTIPKANISSLVSFQAWLTDSVMNYLKGKGASIDEIEDTLASMLAKPPFELPTFENLYSHLKAAPSRDYLRLSLRVLALLRPAIITLKSYRLIALPALIRPST
jgi:hypothetical protein